MTYLLLERFRRARRRLWIGLANWLIAQPREPSTTSAARLHVWRAWLLEEDGDVVAALRDYRRAIAFDPGVARLPFHSDRERVEHLFALYETLTAPLLPAAPKSRKRTRKS